MAEPATAALADVNEPENSKTVNSFSGFNNLDLLRQLGLMIGLAASVAIGVAVVLWSWEGDYRPLYASLDQIDSSDVLDVLDSQQIKYRIDSRSGALLVAADQIHQARLQLASAGIASDRVAGFELLDQEQPLGTSQFMENARYRRSLEGELSRTIASIGAIRSARVHLAIPKNTAFLRDTREPRASVLIEGFQGRAIDESQVRAIANLVASSVPELKLKNVTVVDQRGNLLSHFSQNAEYSEAARQLTYTRQLETDLLQRISSLLDPILGADKYRAEIAADLDFTRYEQTAETFNPELPVVRSEQVSDERQSSGETGEAAGVPGALTNQPPATGQTEGEVVENALGESEASAATVRSQATRNFEIDRTISHTRNQVGKIRRLTVAVAVDDMSVSSDGDGDSNSEGNPTKQAWSAAELERLTVLVRNAVGFDASRGDDVTVINTPFLAEKEEALPLPETPIWKQSWFTDILNKVLGALAFLLLIFFVLRPALQQLTTNAKRIKELEQQQAMAVAALQSTDDGSGIEGNVTLTGGSTRPLIGPDGSGIDKKLETVRGLVTDNPERVAQVVKSWTGDE